MLTSKKNISNKFGLSPEITDLLRKVFSEFPAIRKVKIYGSRAKGNFRPGSDIDFAVDAPDFSYRDLLKLEDRIDELMLLYKIDLLDCKKLKNADLKAHIDTVGQTFFRRKSFLDGSL